MTVVAGLPWKFATSILSVLDVMLAYERFALQLRSNPTPPIAAPALFLTADVVMSVWPRMSSYLTGSS
jgi:hypothetical protein